MDNAALFQAEGNARNRTLSPTKNPPSIKKIMTETRRHDAHGKA